MIEDKPTEEAPAEEAAPAKPTSLEQPPLEHTTVDGLGQRAPNELTQPKETDDAAT